MTNKKILFVVEGKAEQVGLKSYIINHIGLNVDECNIITYKTSIYELYDLLNKKENDGISLSSILIKEKYVDVDSNFQLDSTFAAVYLVFDFDPQYHKYSEDKIRYFASRFVDETDEGLLLIDYPMFESLLDIESFDNYQGFENQTTQVISSAEYKKIVKKRTCIRDEKNNVYKYINDKGTFIKIAEFNLAKYLKLLG